MSKSKKHINKIGMVYLSNKIKLTTYISLDKKTKEVVSLKLLIIMYYDSERSRYFPARGLEHLGINNNLRKKIAQLIMLG